MIGLHSCCGAYWQTNKHHKISVCALILVVDNLSTSCVRNPWRWKLALIVCFFASHLLIRFHEASFPVFWLQLWQWNVREMSESLWHMNNEIAERFCVLCSVGVKSVISRMLALGEYIAGEWKLERHTQETSLGFVFDYQEKLEFPLCKHEMICLTM
jgi:hypothetical protein